MRLEMIKSSGGIFIPASDMVAEKTTKFKTGEIYPLEIKYLRNPAFHSKVFKFFNHCFQFWASDREFMDEQGQFDVFRKQLTVTAGYYDQFFKFDGSVRIEAKSLSFASMSQEEYEQCYQALIQAAMTHIFKGCSDEEVYQQLVGFF